jgi:hypothetical protein
LKGKALMTSPEVKRETGDQVWGKVMLDSEFDIQCYREGGGVYRLIRQTDEIEQDL